MTSPLRVVVADDQTLARTGFRMILMADGIDVVAEATGGAEAVDAVRRTRPDVVLMDIRMPEPDGLEAPRRILTGTSDPPRVIILTTFDLDDLVYAALSAGASGFLRKDVTPEHLVSAVPWSAPATRSWLRRSPAAWSNATPAGPRRRPRSLATWPR